MIRRRVHRTLTGLTATALVAATLSVLSVPTTVTPAVADPAPIASRSSSSVTADVLPTAQIDGVVWDQVTLGNTVYAGGSFSKARPAGAAPGASTEVARGNLLAFDITTGVLNPSFAPVLNAEVKAVALSPDGSKLYVGGSFTTADGATHNHIAAYSTSSGTLLSSFNASVDSTVNAIAATNSAVYVGGTFSNAGSVARARLAAFDPTSGALLGWAPTASAGVNALTVSPDGSRVIAGGQFTSVNGSSSAYGLASLSVSDGSLQPWAVNSIIQDGGPNAAILSLTTDGTNIIGTGYKYGVGGNFEGTFSADPSTGNLIWMEDCHGDTYSAFPMNGSVYIVSHSHFCGNINGFPQGTPTNLYHRTLQFLDKPTGTLKHNIDGSYTDFGGQPSPTLVDWFPDLATGTYTGQTQAAWSTTGNSTYLVLGGEFPSVNGVAQQGLVRFATSPTVTPKNGPTLTGSYFLPTAQALSTTSVRLAWQANYDRDDQNLSYKLVRNGAISKPIYTTSVASQPWNRPGMSFVDTGLTPGATYQYRIFATDPDGNAANGDTVNITVPTADPGPYVHDVLNDGASNYWRLDEASGATATPDIAGNDFLSLGTSVTHGTAGALTGSNTADNADTFSGTASTGMAQTSDQISAPSTFTIEAWINTTTTKGGKIIGFGNQTLGNTSSIDDRHVYMDNAGHLIFGVFNNTPYVATSTNTYNDGAWHQVVATLSGSGLTLFVDGVRVARNSNTTVAKAYTGYWRLGGDLLNGWPSAPTSIWFNGAIDEVSIYPTALNQTQIDQHFADSQRTLNVPARPSDSYGSAVYGDSPDFYWRLDDTSGTTAADASINKTPGLYSGTETFSAASPVSGSTGTAVKFDGSSGTIGSVGLTTNPTVYSAEAWFNTTTAKGGTILGFGNAQTGTSTSYDRDVYMLNNGQLVFGTNGSSYAKAQTTTAFNDGKWHHVVATQGTHGMVLYVDGQSVATNAATTAQVYDGYWRVGGDANRAGTAATSTYFAGTIDEVATYSAELTATQVLAHYKASPASVNRPPVASGTVSCSYTTCNFDGTASSDPDGTVSTYSWNFGDSTTAGTGVKVSHTYSKAGTFTAVLTVTDNQGATATKSIAVTTTAPPANQPPTASFTSSCSYLNCSLNGSASSDPDGTISSYSWNFGDGTTATGATVSHTYTSAGTYTIKLTVTDNGGATGTKSISVTVVADQPPTASFTSSCSFLNCSFDASASKDPDGTISSYAWDFGDGTMSSGVTATRTYAAAGTYTVKLTVTDDQGMATVATKSVTVVANVAPTASYTYSCTNLNCSFDGTGSSDPDGSVRSYAWTFGDGTQASTPQPTHSYSAAGTYGITLTVTDDQGATGSTTKTVSVAPNVAPTAAYTSTCTYLACQFDGSTSSDPDGSVSTYAWNFGDGTTSALQAPAHTFSGAGTYTVTLTVTDNQGATGSSSKSLTVAPNTAPTASYTYTCTGLTCSFDGTPSSDSDGTIATYAWDFGDGSNSTASTPNHTYSGFGNWNVTLTVTDNAGASGVTTKQVTTAPIPNQPPVAAYSYTVSGLSVSFDATSSTDSDGSITSYAWDYGDGSTGSGSTSSHTYAGPGVFTVVLTVTDNSGATGSSSKSITVNPATIVASDSFTRSQSSNWGTADTGGVWTPSTAASFSTDGSTGKINLSAAGASPSIFLGGISQAVVSELADISVPSTGTGTGTYVGLVARHSGKYDYRLKARFMAGGVLHLTLSKVVNGTETVLKEANVTGITYSPGDNFRMRFVLTGTGTTTLSGKIWKLGTPEPSAVQITIADTESTLQGPGSVGMMAFLSATATTVPVLVTVDNFSAYTP